MNNEKVHPLDKKPYTSVAWGMEKCLNLLQKYLKLKIAKLEYELSCYSWGEKHVQRDD